MNKILIAIFIMLACLTSAFAQKQQIPDSIPQFVTFLKYDQPDKVTYLDIPDTGKIVFYFYDPGCGHCQKVGKNMADVYDQFSKDISFYFISIIEQSYVDGYINRYVPSFKTKENVHFLFDPGIEFFEKFNPSNYPSVYVYDAKSKALVTFLDGDVNVKELIPFLK